MKAGNWNLLANEKEKEETLEWRPHTGGVCPPRFEYLHYIRTSKRHRCFIEIQHVRPYPVFRKSSIFFLNMVVGLRHANHAGSDSCED
jgi:hypothetical protein